MISPLYLANKIGMCPIEIHLFIPTSVPRISAQPFIHTTHTCLSCLVITPFWTGRKLNKQTVGITVFKQKEWKCVVVHKEDGGIQVPSLKKDKDIDPRAISASVRILLLKRQFLSTDSEHDRSTWPSTQKSWGRINSSESQACVFLIC